MLIITLETTNFIVKSITSQEINEAEGLLQATNLLVGTFRGKVIKVLDTEAMI